MVYDPAFVFQQYDHQLFLNTVLGPGAADATVLRLAAPGVPFKGKGLALTTDANPGWCAVDPRAGTAATVAEAVLNVACVGGRPVAAVDCLNFGNPEHPVVMWQLSEAIDGMAEACLALGVPVVGGNVSLYNESDGEDIYPTPVVGVVGVIEDLSERPPGIGLTSGSTLVLLGELSSALGGSRWCLDVLRELGGPLAPLDLVAHVDLCELVRSLAAERSHELGVVGIHDVADGGLALCLAEMCAASGVGAATSPGVVTTPAELFSEAPSRVIVASVEPEAVLLAAENAGVPARVLGQGGSDRLVVGGRARCCPVGAIARRGGARSRLSSGPMDEKRPRRPTNKPSLSILNPRFSERNRACLAHHGPSDRQAIAHGRRPHGLGLHLDRCLRAVLPLQSGVDSKVHRRIQHDRVHPSLDRPVRVAGDRLRLPHRRRPSRMVVVLDAVVIEADTDRPENRHPPVTEPPAHVLRRSLRLGVSGSSIGVRVFGHGSHATDPRADCGSGASQSPAIRY